MNKKYTVLGTINTILGTLFHLPSSIILMFVAIYKVIVCYRQNKEFGVVKLKEAIDGIITEMMSESEGFRRHFDWIFWTFILITLI